MKVSFQNIVLLHLQKVAELAESKKSDYKNLLKELLLFNNTFVVFFKMWPQRTWAVSAINYFLL